MAWEFTEVLPGSFERDREGFRGVKFPIIGPLPVAGYQTRVAENGLAKPPYLYVVYNHAGEIKYIGKGTDKSLESVLQRWIRPDKFSGKHYWAHGTNCKKKKTTIASIAEELARDMKPVRFYFASYERLFPLVEKRATALGYDVCQLSALQSQLFIRNLEQFMIYRIQPEWNAQDKKTLPMGPIAMCGDYWVSGQS